MYKLYLWIRKKLFGIDDRSILEIAIERGMVVGKNVSIQDGCTFDISHCWLIELGDNVTFAPRVNLIAHDASTKRELGYTLIGHIKIGNNVFVGAGTTILPNVKIGDNVVIGAGSVVTKSIPANSVAAGNPAKVIMSYEEYIEKRRKQFEECVKYDYSYTINGGVTKELKEKMKLELSKSIGAIE